METEKKVAIVTGSATGVGAAVCMQLAELGWNVVVNYAKSVKEALDTVKKCNELGSDTLLCKGDVSDDRDCVFIVKETVQKWGRIDALVNNAGTTKFCDFSDLDGLDDKDFIRMYKVNVVGAYQMTRAAASYLKKAGGSVVNTSSIAGLTGMGSSIAYCASKGAMNTLTLSLAQALGPEVRVNAVCPGFIETRWTRDFLGERYEEVRQRSEDASALKLTSKPEDTAEAIVYFVTGAKVTTGQIMIVDGGSTLGQVTLGRK